GPRDSRVATHFPQGCAYPPDRTVTRAPVPRTRGPGRPGLRRLEGGSGMRVALALGSGGARGYAHIGAIRELESRGREVVGVAGASMGAIVGALLAAGHRFSSSAVSCAPSPRTSSSGWPRAVRPIV